MASGDLYRSRVRTGNLSGALKPVFDYFAQKREEQKQKDYIKGLLDAFVSTQGKMDDIQNPQIKKELIPQQNDDLQSGQQVDLTRRNALQQTKPQQFSQNTSPETIMSYLRQRNEPTELPIDVQQGDVPAPQEMRSSEQNTGISEEPQMGEQQIIDEMGKRLDSRTYNVSGNMFPQTKEKLMKKAITDFQVKQLFDAENQKYVNPQQVIGLANVLYSRLPQKPEVMNVSQGTDVVGYNRETGEMKTIYQNKKEEKSKEQRLKSSDFKVSEDGFYMYWDDDKKGWTKTKEKAPKDKGEQSAQWARLFYEMEKDKQKGTEEKSTAQEEYNTVMQSPWKTKAELKAMGFGDLENMKHDGAYVYNEKGNNRLIYGDDELQTIARQTAPKAPNKWARDKTKPQKDEKKFIEGKTYVDAKGNKAIYKNGKFEKIK